MFRTFFYILTNTWHLSNSSPVSVIVKRVPSAVASCIWPESKKPNSDLEYRTCSPSVGNSCHRQNQEQSGFLEELITKNRNVQAKDRTHLESCQPKVNSWSLTLVLNSLNSSFSQSIGISLLWGKNGASWHKKAWCSSCRQGAPQTAFFILFFENRWKKNLKWKNRVWSSWKEIV